MTYTYTEFEAWFPTIASHIIQEYLPIGTSENRVWVATSNPHARIIVRGQADADNHVHILMTNPAKELFIREMMKEIQNDQTSPSAIGVGSAINNNNNNEENK